MTNWYGAGGPVSRTLAPPISPQARSALDAAVLRETLPGRPVSAQVGPSAQATGVFVENRCANCRTHYGDALMYGSGVTIVRCVRSECRKANRDRTPIFYGSVVRDAPESGI